LRAKRSGLQAGRIGLRAEFRWIAREAEWVAGKADWVAREAGKATIGEKWLAGVKITKRWNTLAGFFPLFP
jgi:hypothetical protein